MSAPLAFVDSTKLPVVRDEIGVEKSDWKRALNERVNRLISPLVDFSQGRQLALGSSMAGRRSHVLSRIREISDTHTRNPCPWSHDITRHGYTRSQPTASSLCHEFPIDSRRFEFHASQIQPHADICGQIAGYRRADASWLPRYIHSVDEIEVRKKRWRRGSSESFGSADWILMSLLCPCTLSSARILSRRSAGA